MIRRSGFFLCLLLAVVPLAAETTIGGSAENWLQALVNPADLLSTRLGGTTMFRPEVHVTDARFEFSFQGTVQLALDTKVMTFALDSLELNLHPADFLGLALGRFQYAPGSVPLLSPTAYFTVIDYQSLLQGRITDAPQPADLVQARLFWGDVSMVLTLDPFPRESLLPDTDSPWFPKNNFPPSIHITFPVDQVLVLSGITVAPAAAGPVTLQSMSGSVQLSATIRSLDISALYYHGRDHSLLFQGQLDFPHGLFQDYTITLTPVQSTIDAFGCTAALNLFGFRFTADASYTLSKTFVTNRLSNSDLSTLLASGPYLEYACGVGYDLDAPRLSVDLEWKGAWLPSPPAAVIAPLLSSLLYGRASIRLGGDGLSMGVSGAVSTSDWSAIVLGNLSLDPSNELSFQLLVPFFIGAPATELGQYSSNHLVTLGAVWRF